MDESLVSLGLWSKDCFKKGEQHVQRLGGRNNVVMEEWKGAQYELAPQISKGTWPFFSN